MVVVVTQPNHLRPRARESRAYISEIAIAEFSAAVRLSWWLLVKERTYPTHFIPVVSVSVFYSSCSFVSG